MREPVARPATVVRDERGVSRTQTREGEEVGPKYVCAPSYKEFYAENKKEL